MWHQFSSRNPFRPADWRFQRALLAAQGKLPLSRKRDDPWVIRATRFLKALAACQDEFDQWRLEEQEPGLFWARQLYLAAEDKQRPARYTIEALLLAQEDPKTIAHRARTEADTILAYEAMFYDVTEAARAKQNDWLLTHALGPAVRRGLNGREYDLLWKLLGLHGGPLAVYRMVELISVQTAPTERAGTDNWLRDVFHSWQTTNAVVAQATMQINGFTQIEICKQYQDLCVLEKQGGRGGGTEGLITNSLATIMGCMQIEVGPDKSARNPKLALADSRAAEPRCAEVLAYSAGRDYEVDAELMSLSFPEPGPRS